MVKKDPLREVVDKIWPKTKKELEKDVEGALKLLSKGKEHLMNISDKSISKTKKISLGFKKEKLYYKLGKLTANTPKTQWKDTQKISLLIKEIKEIDKSMKKI
ncbi:MAG: hypothetical protein KAI91_05895 [Candidatus Omnitrophica bacterium]|nr:hypothetical protein [Candidatus Omnitrophota bacterium]MCK5393852.1 hypothetical protein [Candidatus Omnitrophota bacterium]